MNYTEWAIGKERTEKILEAIKSRISIDDPEHLIYGIIDVEIEKVINQAPITFEKIERVLTGDLNPGNGLITAACKENLENVDPVDKDSLQQKNAIILAAVKNTYFSRVYLEVRSAIRQHIKEKKNEDQHPM